MITPAKLQDNLTNEIEPVSLKSQQCNKTDETKEKNNEFGHFVSGEREEKTTTDEKVIKEIKTSQEKNFEEKGIDRDDDNENLVEANNSRTKDAEECEQVGGEGKPTIDSCQKAELKTEKMEGNKCQSPDKKP